MSCCLQYLTMDCCGAGRLFEAMFDMLAFFWWLAGAITLTVRCVRTRVGGAQTYSLAGKLGKASSTLQATHHHSVVHCFPPNHNHNQHAQGQ